MDVLELDDQPKDGSELGEDSLYARAKNVALNQTLMHSITVHLHSTLVHLYSILVHQHSNLVHLHF